MPSLRKKKVILIFADIGLLISADTSKNSICIIITTSYSSAILVYITNFVENIFRGD